MLPLLPLRIGVSVVSLALVAIHLIFPAIVLDGVTLALTLIALLPWLQPIFKTVKLPGGIELTLQDMKQEIQAAAGAAQSAERKADLAVSGIVSPADAGATPRATYVTIDREWKTGDRVDVQLPMSLHTEAMPDNLRVIAVMYGPMMLVGDLGNEGLDGV